MKFKLYYFYLLIILCSCNNDPVSLETEVVALSYTVAPVIDKDSKKVIDSIKELAQSDLRKFVITKDINPNKQLYSFRNIKFKSEANSVKRRYFSALSDTSAIEIHANGITYEYENNVLTKSFSLKKSDDRISLGKYDTLFINKYFLDKRNHLYTMKTSNGSTYQILLDSSNKFKRCILENWEKSSKIIIYNYDTLGRIKEEITKTISGYEPMFQSKLFYEYIDNTNLVKSTISEGYPRFQFQTMYNYDSQNHRVRELQINLTTKDTVQYNYKYNTFGDLTKKTYIRADGTITITKYEYTYDNRGNWIKKVEPAENGLSNYITREFDYKKN